MPNAHVEVRMTVRQNDSPKDYCVNNLYFSGGGSTAADFQRLTDALSTLYHLQNATPLWGPFNGRGFQVKGYDLADAKPRPIKAITNYTPTVWASGTMLPRQIAIVLSYYGDRNLPSRRGHIYLGPWDMLDVNGDRVTGSTMARVVDLGKKLYQLDSGASNPWLHSVHSAKLGTTLPVAHYYCNDVYDTQRRRVPKETTRVRYDP